MRTVSLSSRLQWSFRGTVLPGALATGDVDNDGCKEFVVGSVQGELAIFRGRGGCGTWRYSEDQIEPEYDCWDAVERGELPIDFSMPTHMGISEHVQGVRRQSTYNSSTYGTMSNRESISVDDLMHLYDGVDRGGYAANSAETSEDEAAGAAARKLLAGVWGAENTGHVKWEDALDLERDGRKPWILAQNLGTISSVVVADVSNSGHNSVVVVNGEGKCHIFDYPFKRRLHPEMSKRKRQRNHYRRFSQDRFFKNGVIIDPVELHDDHPSEYADETAADSSNPANAPDHVCKDQHQPGGDAQVPAGPYLFNSNASTLKRPQIQRTKSAYSELPTGANFGFSDAANRMDEHLREHRSSSISAPGARVQDATAISAIPHGATGVASDLSVAKATWRPTSGLESQIFDTSQTRLSTSAHDGGIPKSNVSSQADQPLTILSKRDIREHPSAVLHEPTSRALDPTRQHQSPAPMRASVSTAPGGAAGQDMYGAEASSGGRRGYPYQKQTQTHQQQNQHVRPDASDAGVDSLSVAFGDGDMDSEQDFAEVLSDIGDNALLTSEEVADIEKIWGANIGKKSGDWFPFILDQPDMTFSIPTNVEHALVDDIDNNGLNELVLTATDGFVYIFRIESTVKHAIKPMLTSVGMFSNNPTTLPSVNMTGNGSPYLYMSAPRSPDASDIDLDFAAKGPKPSTVGKRFKKPCIDKNLGPPDEASNAAAPAAQAPAAPPAPSHQPDNIESDLNLVNHLLKSIKDVSATPSCGKPDRSFDQQAGHIEGLPTVLVAEPTSIQPPSISPDNEGLAESAQRVPASANSTISPTNGRTQGAGRRQSLTSRMRENLSGIVSGWDTIRKPLSLHNQTAPPSISHSRINTANNSGTSTNTHSRVPSISEAELDHSQILSALSLNSTSSGGRSEGNAGPPKAALAAIHSSSAMAAFPGELRVPRSKNSIIATGSLNVMEGIPERLSIETDSRNGSEPSKSAKSQGGSAQLSDKPSCSQDASSATSGETSPQEDPLSASGAQQEPTSVSGLVDSLAHHRRVGSSSGRTNNRTEGLVKAIGTGSRGHSRHGSVSSTSKARVTSSSSAAISTVVSALPPHGRQGTGDREAGSGEHTDTPASCIASRRTSLGSNVSLREDGTQNGSGAVKQAAEPLEVAVSARGSFSKPVFPSAPPVPPPARPTDAEDNNSVISQVTERLAELTMKAKHDKKGPLTSDSPGITVPMARPPKTNTLYEHNEKEYAAPVLPPPRKVVDWSTTTADNVATWFLDNIPGNVAMVRAPTKAFGEPLTLQRRNVEYDELSDYSCSSCSCSLCVSSSGSNSESEIEDEIEARQPIEAPPKLKPATLDIQVTGPDGFAAQGRPGFTTGTLPRQLLLEKALKDKQSTKSAKDDTRSDVATSDLDPALDTDKPADKAAEDKPSKEPVTTKTVIGELRDETQQFLILSKPGGRFVPIDMVNGAMMATIEPPPVPLAIMTGGNTAHLMNVDTGKALRNIQLAVSVGMALPQLSGFEYAGFSGSYVGQSSSWHSGSMPWSQSIQHASGSYGSGINIAKSPANPYEQGEGVQPAAQEVDDSEQIATEHRSSTEEPLISQFPSNSALNSSNTDSASPATRSQQEYANLASVTASAASVGSRQSQSSITSSSVFNPGSGGGPMSLSSNLRTMRSMQRISTDSSRGQNFNPGHGPSPIYRGMSLSGSMTPVAGGFSHTSSQYERRHLGFAGLRGYIGNGIGRHRTSGGPMTSSRIDDVNHVTGYFSPVTSGGQPPARGQSAGPLGQAMGTATMPREPLQGYSSSVSTSASITNAMLDRSGGRARIDSVRQYPRGHRSSPTASGVTSVSPQRSQQNMRYSPSMAAWSSFKDGSILSTIKDQEDLNEADENAPEEPVSNPTPLATSHGADGRLPGDQVTSLPASSMHTPLYHPGADKGVSSFGDDASAHGRGTYWTNTEPPSARSHSSLATGISANAYHHSEEKEEEIEEAPQPMELDVATYMVGGVSAGKRLLRRLMPFSTDAGHNKGKADADADEDTHPCVGVDNHLEMCEINEMLSLVTMDGVINCYDPIRKVSHFVSLSAKDPVLGIWKVKMHDEVCRPSILSTLLQQAEIEPDSAVAKQIAKNTPSKKMYRRVGLSNRDLLYAVRYSSYIEERVQMVNRLDTYRRVQSKRRLSKARGQTRLSYGVMTGERPMTSGAKRDGLSSSLSRNNTMSRTSKQGLNNRIRDNLTKYNKVGRVVRNLGNHIRDFTSGGSSALHSTADSSVPANYATSSHLGTDDAGTTAIGLQSELTTPDMATSPTTRKHRRIHNTPGGLAGRRKHDVDEVSDYCIDEDGDDESGADDHHDRSYGDEPAQHQQQVHYPRRIASSGSHQIGAANYPSANMGGHGFLGAAFGRYPSRTFNSDLAIALSGWYGENKNDYRRTLRVSDHLVVSTWRGTTYFIDVSTLLDTAHYNELFMNRWNMSLAAVAENVVAATGNPSEREWSMNHETRSGNMGSVYGSLSEFSDINGIMSRLRANASVIQFKFQDTVSAFLADTYAPATGGPNVPCMFYVDYKDRIWVYYHLDEIAEMDDVYGATWFRDEPESLSTPSSRARAIESGVDSGSCDKPFSVVDLAYRRINQEPWIPLIGDESYINLVSYNDCIYPYSSKTWRKRVDSRGQLVQETDVNNQYQQPGTRPERHGSTEDNSLSPEGTTSTQAFAAQANANITGRFHSSYLPGPYLCPIWADINSVDLYDVGACNLLELVTPELLVFKDLFCQDLGLDPNSIDERVSLATVPGLANWVREMLYSQD
ncbi:hypothetical protein GGI07_005000 [Coemansia sp. Benny D115]|nr:hypothetical protein GGI07_005000 [Coemansia sp. Benny D115]